MSLSGAQSRTELALLADPELLKERLAQLAEAEEQANGVLALIGPANEIIAIREQVGNELDEAAKNTEATQIEAEAILQAARENAEAIVQATEEESKVILQTAANRDGEAAALVNEARENLAETQREADRLQGLERSLNERDAQLSEREVSLIESTDSLLQEKAQLATIREHMTNFLD